jgi:hypothetical protein
MAGPARAFTMTCAPGAGRVPSSPGEPMPTALRRTEPVTIAAFDAFVETQV